MAIVFNEPTEPSTATWDVTIRVNYTTREFGLQHEPTVACLYCSPHGHGPDKNGSVPEQRYLGPNCTDCPFTFTIPRTDLTTDPYATPATADFAYGYGYSGFLTLQVARTVTCHDI